MEHSKKWMGTLVFSLLIHSICAHADSFSQIYLGAVGGVASPTVNGTDLLHDRATLGGSAGYRINEYISVGTYLSYSQKLEESTGAIHPFLLTGIESDFYSSWIDGLHAGLKVGLIRGTISVPGRGAIRKTEFSFGPKIGYDYMLFKGLSLGAELNSMLSTDNKYVVFNYLGVVKYAFGI